MTARPPTDLLAAAAQVSGESSTERMVRRFRRDLPARIGLRVILVLFAIAAFAPFLANSHALYRSYLGHSSFPFLLSLEPIEWRFLLYGVAAGLAYYFRASLRRLPGGLLSSGLLVIVVVETFLAFHPTFNDSTNDRTRPADFKIMPLVRYSPVENSADQFSPPSWTHPCGTDSTGRDIAARLLHGARTSLSIGLVSQGIALVVGVTLGGLAGFYRGWIDIALLRFVEIIECFPSLLLILVAVSLFNSQNNLFYIMAIIGLTSWTGLARLVRGEFLKLGGQPFTEAAQALGAGDWRIITRHILPNALSPILVFGAFGIASAILIESSLSFLGFGMQAPTPSWGDILNESRRYLDFAWWLAFFPGLAILITIMSYNLVGEGLRDAVDARLQIK